MSEYKGDMALPTYTQYCQQIMSHAVKTNSKVRCSDCKGIGFITEDVKSSQGNYHEIEEVCETCCGDGEILAMHADDNHIPVTEDQYIEDMIYITTSLSSWTGTDLFLNMCKCKGLFNGELING